eukprot:9483707-Pyramimonas_sp.AAC.2
MRPRSSPPSLPKYSSRAPRQNQLLRSAEEVIPFELEQMGGGMFKSAQLSRQCSWRGGIQLPAASPATAPAQLSWCSIG